MVAAAAAVLDAASTATDAATIHRTRINGDYRAIDRVSKIAPPARRPGVGRDRAPHGASCYPSVGTDVAARSAANARYVARTRLA
jgi:hypothetical protein